MTSLEELKKKWFVDVSQEDRFPPQNRHRASMIRPSSDGNLAEPLIDGAVIMGDFHYRLLFNQIVDPYSGPKRGS